MKHNPIKKATQSINPNPLNIGNLLKLNSPRQNTTHHNTINKPNVLNPHINLFQKKDEKSVAQRRQQKNKYQFSYEDEHRLKYVQKCLMQALKSGHKLSEYQLKANTEIIRKLKSVVHETNKEKDKLCIVNWKKAQTSPQSNKQNKERFSFDEKNNKKQYSHLNKNILHIQKERKREMIRQSYFANNNSAAQSHIKLRNFCGVYGQKQNNLTSGQSIQKSDEGNKKASLSKYKLTCNITEKNQLIYQQCAKSARQKQISQCKKIQKEKKQLKRVLRANQNYLISTKISSSVSKSKRNKSQNIDSINSGSQTENIDQSQNETIGSSRLSKRLIKINNKPHVIIMKTINNNYNSITKNTKNQGQIKNESMSLKKNNLQSSKVEKSNLKPNNQHEGDSIRNNQQKIQMIFGQINRLKLECKQKDQVLLQYQQKVKELRQENKDLLKKIEQSEQPISLDVRLSLKYIQKSPQQDRQAYNKRPKLENNCQICQKKQEKVAYMKEKVIDLQMILISQNNQIESLRKTLSDYIIKQDKSLIFEKNIQCTSEKAKSTLPSQKNHIQFLQHDDM